MIALPPPVCGGMAIEDAIDVRRSVRDYVDKSLSLVQLSRLLWAAQGVTGKTYGHALRSAPSAGALYPIEVYVVAHAVEGLERGIYHYRVGYHALELVKEGDFRRGMERAGLEQKMLGAASATFVLSAVFERTRAKYGERSLRYVYLEAGHISQNVALEAVSLGLGSVCVGAFRDDAVNGLLGLDGKKESAVYVQAVGFPAR